MAAPQFQIVVAHYNEDLSWLSSVEDDCVVYTKGPPRHTCTLPHTVLPNIGREGHTYLYHIITQYDKLADVTLFTQGNVEDHITFLSADCLQDDYTTQTALHMKKKALTAQHGQFVTFPFRELETFDHWEGIPWEDYPAWKKWAESDKKEAPYTPGQYFAKFISRNDPNSTLTVAPQNIGHIPISIGYQPGAVFALTRSTIWQRPLQYYIDLMQDFFLGEMEHPNPVTGYYIERFWPVIFNPDEYCLWDPNEKADTELNEQGQLAKGHWHEMPKWVDSDLTIVDPRDPNRKVI